MTIGIRQEAANENIISFVLSSIFLIVVAASIYYLHQKGIDFSITIFELVILSLATFRLTRLLVYDNIALFMRDFVLDKTKTWDSKAGLYTVIREKPKKGLRRKLAELLDCPWCTGVWVSIFVIFFHYFTPLSWYVYLLLSIAGISTFIQLTANLIGWSAQGKKVAVQKEGSKK